MFVDQKEGWTRNLKQQTEQSEVPCQISTACALELHQGVTVHVLQPQRLINHDFIIFQYCSSELQQWDKESKDTFIVVIRCKSEGTYFFLYEDLLVVLHKV